MSRVKIRAIPLATTFLLWHLDYRMCRSKTQFYWFISRTDVRDKIEDTVWVPRFWHKNSVFSVFTVRHNQIGSSVAKTIFATWVLSKLWRTMHWRAACSPIGMFYHACVQMDYHFSNDPETCIHDIFSSLFPSDKTRIQAVILSY